MRQSNKVKQERVITADGYTELLAVTWLEPHLVRLEESAILADARFHDVVEIERQTDGSLKIVRMVSRSGMETVSWVLATGVLELPEVAGLLQKVSDGGGHWEAGAGMLTVHFQLANMPLMKADFEDLWQRLNDQAVGRNLREHGNSPECK